MADFVIANQRVPRTRADDRLREAIHIAALRWMDCFVASAPRKDVAGSRFNFTLRSSLPGKSAKRVFVQGDLGWSRTVKRFFRIA
jgi:hypothetical protein